MNHIIAYSGGIASAIVAEIIKNKYPNTTILLFHDTKTEPDDNYRFRREFAEYLKLPITDDSDGRDIWQLFKDENYLGNARNTMCSRIFKQERSKAFCLKNKPCKIYFGFTPNEWRRAQNAYSRYQQIGIKAKFPLIENKITKADCKRILKIRRPAMYCHFDHANCMPCIKGKLKYWGLVYRYERDAWDRAVQAEKEHNHTILTDGRTLTEALSHCLAVAKKVND
jgi:hypothetical protein